MKILKQTIQKALSWLGYALIRLEDLPVRSSEPDVIKDNFANLSRVYEQKLNGITPYAICPNDTRPKLLARLLGTPPSEAYFIIQGLAKSKDIAGNVCEFGVAQGETSALIANEISDQPNKIFHLFDSFEGLPEPTEKDKLKDDIFKLGSMQAYAGTMSCPESLVRARLEDISFPADRYRIHKGFIEQLINTDNNLPEEVCFAYVDFDFYEPIKISLDYLHRVTPLGATIVVDDYDFFSTGAKLAVDEWMGEMNSGGAVYECFVPDPLYGYFAVITKIRSTP